MCLIKVQPFFVRSKKHLKTAFKSDLNIAVKIFIYIILFIFVLGQKIRRIKILQISALYDPAN